MASAREVVGAVEAALEATAPPGGWSSGQFLDVAGGALCDAMGECAWDGGDVVRHGAACRFLQKEVSHIRVCERSREGAGVQVHLYRLEEEDPVDEELWLGGEGDGGAEQISSFRQWTLPAADFEGAWESLVYDECSLSLGDAGGGSGDGGAAAGGERRWSGSSQEAAADTKMRLLRYVNSSLLFSAAGVSPNLVSWNRVMLFHGPPGTGKTSLCKALAHKAAIRLSLQFDSAVLVEINAHSLFSKWFSESGKLVMRMFSTIFEMLEDERLFVAVLIDEVESLAAARQASMGGADPSDAIRVVNALLTQLDHLRRFRNVVILTTSNITGAIDDAFVDRADIKVAVGPPGLGARYEMLRTSLQELMARHIIAPDLDNTLLEWTTLKLLEQSGSQASDAVLEVAGLCEGLSGRTVRKLPFLAHALFLSDCTDSVSLALYVDALRRAAENERHQRQRLRGDDAGSSSSSMERDS